MKYGISSFRFLLVFCAFWWLTEGNAVLGPYKRVCGALFFSSMLSIRRKRLHRESMQLADFHREAGRQAEVHLVRVDRDTASVVIHDRPDV